MKKTEVRHCRYHPHKNRLHKHCMEVVVHILTDFECDGPWAEEGRLGLIPVLLGNISESRPYDRRFGGFGIDCAFMYKYTDRLGNTENRCLTIWHRPYERFADDTSEWEALGNGE